MSVQVVYAFPTTLEPLKIRRLLGRSEWSTPVRFGPDGWRYAVFDAGWAYQVFAPPSDHVNIHEHALHLFGRVDGSAALPDFTHGSGSI